MATDNDGELLNSDNDAASAASHDEESDPGTNQEEDAVGEHGSDQSGVEKEDDVEDVNGDDDESKSSSASSAVGHNEDEGTGNDLAEDEAEGNVDNGEYHDDESNEPRENDDENGVVSGEDSMPGQASPDDEDVAAEDDAQETHLEQQHHSDNGVKPGEGSSHGSPLPDDDGETAEDDAQETALEQQETSEDSVKKSSPPSSNGAATAAATKTNAPKLFDTIVLIIPPNKNLGVSMKNRPVPNNPTHERHFTNEQGQQIQWFVSEVKDESPLKGQLFPNDIILAIDGEIVLGMKEDKFQRVLTKIKNKATQSRLTILRKTGSPDSASNMTGGSTATVSCAQNSTSSNALNTQFNTLVVAAPPKVRLGVIMKDKIFGDVEKVQWIVNGLTEDSPLRGRLQLGDAILAVDNDILLGLNEREVNEIFAKNRKKEEPSRLTVLRRTGKRKRGDESDKQQNGLAVVDLTSDDTPIRRGRPKKKTKITKQQPKIVPKVKHPLVGIQKKTTGGYIYTVSASSTDRKIEHLTRDEVLDRVIDFVIQMSEQEFCVSVCNKLTSCTCLHYLRDKDLVIESVSNAVMKYHDLSFQEKREYLLDRIRISNIAKEGNKMAVHKSGHRVQDKCICVLPMTYCFRESESNNGNAGEAIPDQDEETLAILADAYRHRICLWSWLTIHHVGSTQWDSLRHVLEGKKFITPQYKLGKRGPKGRNISVYEDLSTYLHDLTEDLKESQPPRRKNAKDTFAIYLPPKVSRRKLYEMWASGQGWVVKKTDSKTSCYERIKDWETQDGFYKTEEEAEKHGGKLAKPVVTWSAFNKFWKEEFPDLKAREWTNRKM